MHEFNKEWFLSSIISAACGVISKLDLATLKMCKVHTVLVILVEEPTLTERWWSLDVYSIIYLLLWNMLILLFLKF